MTNLTDIAEVISGYTLRSAPDYSRMSNLRIIQANNISNSIYLDADKLPTVHLEKVFINDDYVQNNDIILSSRGRFHANVVQLSDEILATSSVFIIRITDTKILPEFLAIYLNSSKAQRTFSQISSGSSVKTILKSALEELEVPTPVISDQKKVIEMFSNIESQNSLLQRKSELNVQLANYSLNDIINKPT